MSYLAGICAPQVTQNPGIITNVPKTVTLVPTPLAPVSTSVSAPPASSSASVVPNPEGSPQPSSILGNSPIGATEGIPQPSSILDNSPVGATPPPAVAQPETTLILSQSVTYACPASQIADGQVQAPAASSCTSLLVTSAIVPQVGFTTGPAAPGATGSDVGLAAGTPAAVPASPTGANPGPGAISPVGATTFGTIVGSGTGFLPPSPTGSVPFTGAASNTKATGFGILAGVIGLLFLA